MFPYSLLYYHKLLALLHHLNTRQLPPSLDVRIIVSTSPPPVGYTDSPGRRGSRGNPSVYSHGGTLSMWGGMSDTSGGRVSPTMSEYFGQQSGPSIFQGMVL